MLIYFDCLQDIYFAFLVLNRSERQLDEVVIALVGKYTALEDAYASVLKALNHAALFCKRKLTIRVRKTLRLLFQLGKEMYCVSFSVCSFDRFRIEYEKR